jgi:hypothetical protein
MMGLQIQKQRSRVQYVLHSCRTMASESGTIDEQEQEIELATARDADSQYSRTLQIFTVYVCLYMTLYSKLARKRRRRGILLERGLYSEKKRCRRSDLPLPSGSPWTHFYGQQNGDSSPSSSWFDWVGLPQNAFQYLVHQCEQAWESSPLDEKDGTPRPCDLKRRCLDCAGTVAMVLYHMNKPVLHSDISKLFGVVETDAQRYIDFGIRVMLPILRDNPFAKIIWPMEEPGYLDRMAENMLRYVPDFYDKFALKPVGWVDGVRFRIANKWSRPKERKQDQSGEKKLTLRKIQLLFDPEGHIVCAVWNTPGKWHDSKCCSRGGLYRRVAQLPDGYCILADTAYKGGLMNSKIIKILSEGQFLPFGMSREELQDLEKIIIRGRQPSEWGNNTFIKFMVRPRCKLGIDDKYNSTIMELSLLLHNIRIHFCDRNQVKRFFQNLQIFDEHEELNPDIFYVDDEEDEYNSEEEEDTSSST